MTSGAMSIPESRPLVPMSRLSKPQPKQEIYSDPNKPEYGFLTREDKELLEKQCGYEFQWPPGSCQEFPGEAFDLAMVRKLEGAKGSTGDLFGAMMRYQEQRLRMHGESAFSDSFLNAVAKTSRSGVAAAFLANGGTSPLYA